MRDFDKIAIYFFFYMVDFLILYPSIRGRFLVFLLHSAEAVIYVHRSVYLFSFQVPSFV